METHSDFHLCYDCDEIDVMNNSYDIDESENDFDEFDDIAEAVS